MPDAPSQPSEEELVARLEEQLRKLTVLDMLLQTVFTLSSLAYRKLAEGDRDLPQARLAIEALKAIAPVLEGSAPEQTVKDLQQAIANLQLAYAQAAASAA